MYKIINIPGNYVETNEGKFLWFGGTSYLGIGKNEEFQNLIIEGISKIGANWGSSRNNNLQLEVYDLVESFLAKKANAPAALTVSSGMLAGQLVLKYLTQIYPKSYTIYAPKVHPALWEQNYLPNLLTVQNFIEQINYMINAIKAVVINIVIDSVSSPHIEPYNFNWVKYLPTNKQINLIIDDSHSFGILNNGKGVFDKIETPNNVYLLVVSSLNKALGVPGGVIFGNKSILHKIKNTTYFSACSPMSPAFAFACASADYIYNSQLQILKKNIQYFNQHITPNLIFGNLKNLSTYCFEDNNIANFLYANKIIVPSFGYPNPADKPITRLVITSLHTQNNLDYLLEKLNIYAQSISN